MLRSLLAVARGLAGPILAFSTAAPAAAQILRYAFEDPRQDAWVHLAELHDVDGDGFGDFAMGEPGDDTIARDAGRVRVVSGASGAVILSLHGSGFRDGYGEDVAGLGDIDGDGVPDLGLVAQHGASPGRLEIRSGLDGSLIRVVQGDAAFGIRGVAGLGDLDGDGRPDLAFGGFAGIRIVSGATGSTLHTLLGGILANGGDVDGDGFSDVVVGRSTPPPGRVHVFSGRTGQQLHVVLGDDGVWDRFGTVVDGLGDVDGDGYGEFVGVAPPTPPDGFGEGYARVFSGRTGASLGLIWSLGFDAFASGVGDVNGDGRPDLVVPITLTIQGSAVFWSAHGNQPIAPYHAPPWRSREAVRIGDVDGDGEPDLALSFVQGFGAQLRASVRVLTLAPVALRIDRHELVAADGGVQELSLHAGAVHAGRRYVVLGTMSGIAPGVLLGGVSLRLNADRYFAVTRKQPGARPLSGATGFLDTAGRATARVTLPPGSYGLRPGAVFHHAFLVLHPSGAVVLASNPAPLVLIEDPCAVLAGLPDCDGDGTLDACQLAAGSLPDCNANGIPDDCELSAGTSLDCNANGIPDECEGDCNGNGIPDDCDLASGTSLDCNGNGIPDDCPSEIDLNQNGIPDECEPRRTYHVDDDAAGDPGPGDPTLSDPLEDGSAARPFDALQKAIDVAISGDTILVEDGLYRGQGNKNVRFAGRSVHVRSRNGAAGCTIDCEGSGSAFRVLPSPASVRENPRIQGFTIRNASQSGIVANGMGRPWILECVIERNSSFRGGGIEIHGSATSEPVVVANCVIRDNVSSSSISGGGIYSSGNTVIRNCLVASNVAPGPGGGIGVFVSGSEGIVELTGSTLVGNRSGPVAGPAVQGAALAVRSTRVVVRNCILWDNGEAGLEDVLVQSGGRAEFAHSDVEGGRTAVALLQSELDWGVGNIDLDPLFRNHWAGDFHLGILSPCRDAGDPAFVPRPGETDLDGEPRVLGTRVDMGSDEHPGP